MIVYFPINTPIMHPLFICFTDINLYMSQCTVQVSQHHPENYLSSASPFWFNIQSIKHVMSKISYSKSRMLLWTWYIRCSTAIVISAHFHLHIFYGSPPVVRREHYTDVIMTTVATQITSLTIVYSIVYSGADQRKHQSSASLAFVRGIHRDRWIPCTKGQLRGKCFHLKTSSWIEGSVTEEIRAVIEDTYMGHKAKVR